MTLCRRHPLQEGRSVCEGQVLERSRGEVRLVMARVPRDLYEGTWRWVGVCGEGRGKEM